VDIIIQLIIVLLTTQGQQRAVGTVVEPPPIRNGAILFSGGCNIDTCEARDTDIWIGAPNGSKLRKLTEGRFRFEESPVWSPDASMIALTISEDWPRDGSEDVYIMSPNGDNLERLYGSSEADYAGDWSPDGTKMVVVSGRPRNSRLYIINATDGSHAEEVTDGPAHRTDPAWSPDGSKIAFGLGRDYGRDIAVLDLASGEVTKVTKTHSNSSPSWSPDGTKITFARNVDRNDDGWHIFIMNSDGSNVRRIKTGTGSWNTNPVYSPNGKWIAFSSGPVGSGYSIFKIRPNGTDVTHLFGGKRREFFAPDWAPRES
jgi:Tol biopolymer transport system component